MFSYERSDGLESVRLRSQATHLQGPLSMGNLLWLVIIVLVILWLGGFSFQIGGSLIHILLVIALILVVIRLATGRKVL